MKIDDQASNFPEVGATPASRCITRATKTENPQLSST